MIADPDSDSTIPRCGALFMKTVWTVLINKFNLEFLDIDIRILMHIVRVCLCMYVCMSVCVTGSVWKESTIGVGTYLFVDRKCVVENMTNMFLKKIIVFNSYYT